MLNFDPPLWPHPIPGDHDFHNFESTLPEDASTQVSTFLAEWFLRRRFLKMSQNFSLISNYLPLKKSVALNFHNFESPLPKDDLCQVWLKLAQ